MRNFKVELFKVEFEPSETKGERVLVIIKLSDHSYDSFNGYSGTPAVARWIENNINWRLSVKEAVKIMSKAVEFFHS